MQYSSFLMNSEWTPQHVSYNENTLQYFDKHPCHSQKFVCKILQLFLKNAKFQGSWKRFRALQYSTRRINRSFHGTGKECGIYLKKETQGFFNKPYIWQKVTGVIYYYSNMLMSCKSNAEETDVEILQGLWTRPNWERNITWMHSEIL